MSKSNEERLEIIKDKQIQMHSLSTFDIEWLIQRASMLQWLREAILICNEESLSPRELARLLDKSNS